MRALACGCELSEIDGFRYRCCDQHADLNPCGRYWPPDVQEAARKRAAEAKNRVAAFGERMYDVFG
jgi:hypothetical protein